MKKPRNVYLKIDEEDDNAKVDEGVGRGDEVRLLVHHEDQGSQQAGLCRTETNKNQNYISGSRYLKKNNH